MRDTLMDDAREKVDELGEEATQNESLGAALDQAYAARFGGSASSAPAAPDNMQQSNVMLEETRQAAADQSSPGELMDTAMQASEDGQRDDAKSEQAADEQVPSSGGPKEPDQAGLTALALGMAQHEATAASGDGAATAETPEESAQAADDQQGGAAAAAGVHAVPAEAAVAAASASDAAVAAPPTGDDTAPLETIAAAAAPPARDAVDPGAASALAQDTPAPSVAPKEAADEHAEKAEPEQELPKSLDELRRRILDWHWSHLEYGCSAPLHKVGHSCMPLTPSATWVQ